MKQEIIINQIKSSNRPENTKVEAIRIIEQYYSNNIQVALQLLFKVIEISPTLIKLFCGD